MKISVTIHIQIHTHTHTHTHIHIHTMEYYSAIKKERNNVICSYLDGPRDYDTKSEREKQIPYDITCKWNLKYDTNELIYDTDSQT